MTQLQVKPNDPMKCGKLASRRLTFGEFNRFALFAVHTRFDKVTWMVSDAEQTDEKTGFAKIIRQADSVCEAMVGLEHVAPDVEVSL